MRKVQIKKKLYMQISTMILCVVALTTLYSVNAFTKSKSEKNAIVGKVYEFDKNDDYDISESDKSSSTDKVETYGEFSILGNIGNVSKKMVSLLMKSLQEIWIFTIHTVMLC